MVIAGLVLLIVGFLTGLAVLWIVGLVLIVLGLVAWGPYHRRWY